MASLQNHDDSVSSSLASLLVREFPHLACNTLKCVSGTCLKSPAPDGSVKEVCYCPSGFYGSHCQHTSDPSTLPSIHFDLVKKFEDILDAKMFEIYEPERFYQKMLALAVVIFGLFLRVVVLHFFSIT